MNPFTSIKHKTLALFLSVCLGLTTLYFIIALLIAFTTEDMIISRFLTLEAEFVEKSYKQNSQLVASRFDFVDIFINEDLLPDELQKKIKNNIGDREIFTSSKEHFHFVTLDFGLEKPGYLIAEVSPILAVTQTPRFLYLFIASLSLGLLICIFVAYKVAYTTVDPIIQLTDAIKSSKPLPSLDYELAYLSKTMQSAINNLSESLLREKEFSNDVNHELRTPLTILSNTISLSEQRGFTEHDLILLKQIYSQMQHTIDVLLALARRDDFKNEDCLIKANVEAAAMQCLAAHQSDFSFKLEIQEDTKVKVNPHLFKLLLINLINNAIEHSLKKELHIEYKDETLLFKNTLSMQGANLANNKSSHLIDKGTKSASSTGQGQGLYLMVRLLKVINWQYDLSTDNENFSISIFTN